MTDGNSTKTTKLPTLNTLLQFAQVGSIIGGVAYVAMLVGARDAMLAQLVKAVEIQTIKLHSVAEQVARIEGRLGLGLPPE